MEHWKRAIIYYVVSQKPELQWVEELKKLFLNSCRRKNKVLDKQTVFRQLF